MTSSTRIRLGALTAAAAVVAGGFFAAVPANAATGNLTVANTTFIAGDWATGLDITGDTFTPGSTVTLTVADATSGATENFVVPTAVDAVGAFSATYIPTFVAAQGDTVTVAATSDAPDDSNVVNLTVNAAPVTPAPQGITTSVTTITAADFTDPTSGISVNAAGYVPGESVTVSVDYNGTTFHLGPYTAQADGSVTFGFYLAAGTPVDGPVTITVAGATLTQSATVQVTGSPVTNNPVPPVVTGGTTTTAAGPAAPVVNLPVVSG